MYKTSVYTKP